MICGRGALRRVRSAWPFSSLYSGPSDSRLPPVLPPVPDVGASPSSCSSSWRPCGGGLLGRLDVLGLLVVPGLPLVERQRDHARVHVGVVAPAQLGALAAEDARLGDLEPGLVRVARERVHLAAQLRDPPRVLDVVRADVERHGHAHRHVHVRVGEDLLVVDRRVRVLPHVLHAVDLDVHRRALGRRLLVGRRRRRRWTATGLPFASMLDAAGFLIPGSITKVAIVRKTRITAAPTVQPISSRVLPWICAATRPLRLARYLNRQ